MSSSPGSGGLYFWSYIVDKEINLRDCNVSTKKECLIVVLNKIIEKPVRERVLLNELMDEKSCYGCIHSLLYFLDVFGVVEFNDEYLKIKSDKARYFIFSIKEYISEGMLLFDGWSDIKGVSLETREDNIFKGTQFLHLMEKRRLHHCPHPKILRKGQVARVIIKAHIDNEDCILFQYDDKTQQFKTIGGNGDDSDVSLESTVKREIREELPICRKLHHSGSYKLVKLYHETRVTVSNTHGALSEYEVHFFLMIDVPDMSYFDLQPNDRWISIDEIKNGVTKDNKAIYETSRDLFNDIESAQYSIRNMQRPSRTTISKMRSKSVLIGGAIKWVLEIINSIKALFLF